MNLEDKLPDEEQERLLKSKDDLESRNKLIVHNLRLVHWVSKKYYNPGVNELDDLFQSGVIGLMKAIDKYDPDKGLFSTYAVLWIKQEIRRYMSTTVNSIRVPEYMSELKRNLIKAKNQLIQELEREPTVLELSIKMGKPIKTINEILNIIDEPISINSVIGGEYDNITLEDAILDNGPTPDIIAADKIFIEQFKEHIKSRLSELEYNCVILFCGIGCEEYSLADIGNKYNKTYEEIRSAKDKGISKIKNMNYDYGVKRKPKRKMEMNFRPFIFDTVNKDIDIYKNKGPIESEYFFEG